MRKYGWFTSAGTNPNAEFQADDLVREGEFIELLRTEGEREGEPETAAVLRLEKGQYVNLLDLSAD